MRAVSELCCIGRSWPCRWSPLSPAAGPIGDAAEMAAAQSEAVGDRDAGPCASVTASPPDRVAGEQPFPLLQRSRGYRFPPRNVGRVCRPSSDDAGAQCRAGACLAARGRLGGRWKADPAGAYGQPPCLPRAKPYMDPKSHRIVAELKDFPQAERRLRVAHGAQDEVPSAAWRSSRPVTSRSSLMFPFPGASSIGRDRRARGGRRGRPLRDVLVVGLGDSFASGEGNPDVPVRFSRDRTADYGDAAKDARLVGYPARVGDWRQIGDKSSSMPTRAGSIRPVTARSTRTSCEQRCKLPSRIRTAP